MLRRSLKKDLYPIFFAPFCNATKNVMRISKFSQNSQENTGAVVSFLQIVDLRLYLKEAPTQISESASFLVQVLCETGNERCSIIILKISVLNKAPFL